MIRWQSHKVVEAGKILTISPVYKNGNSGPGENYTGLFKLQVATEKGTEDVFVDDHYMDRHRPEVGGYFVRYLNDDYISYCPAVPFENGYHKQPGMETLGLEKAEDTNNRAKTATQAAGASRRR